MPVSRLLTFATALAAAALTTATSAPVQLQLQSDFVKVQLTVGPSGTCVSSLSISLALSGQPQSVFTPNILSSQSAACGNVSSTTMAEFSDDLGVLHTASGGTVVSSNSSFAHISGISVGTYASEDWVLSLSNNATWTWHVARTYTTSGAVLTDLFPALFMQTTTGSYEEGVHQGERQGDRASRVGSRRRGDTGKLEAVTDWRTLVQMPSYFGMDDNLLNASAGLGWTAASGALSSALGDRTFNDTREVLLSPSSIWMRMHLESCRFAYTRYTYGWFTQQVGLGADCAALNPYAFEAGDVRSQQMRLDFYPASNGFAWLDLTIPPSSPGAAVVESVKTFGTVYPMLMGWINGNSPASCTCIHEASLFSQLWNIFRLTPPPSDAPADVPGPVRGSCGAFSNPFCGYEKRVDTVEIDIECAGNAVITSITATYGTPTITNSSCPNFVANPQCNEATFQAYAEAQCLGQTSCSLVRNHSDADPCPDVEKAMAVSATCSSDAGGRVVPAPGSCPSVYDAAARQMDFIFAESMLPDGFVFARWDIVTGNTPQTFGIIDQMPHSVLMAYYYAVATNDSAKVTEWMPNLDRIANYMLDTMLVNSTYLLTDTNPACNGVMNFSCADNWLDDVRFGWHDAIVGAYAVEAFRALGEMKGWLGDAEGAATYAALHTQMVQAYNDLYWSEEEGLYHDWVDVNNVTRSYFYTWQNFAAIEFGIASPAQATTILATADRLYAGIREKYNVSEFWCTPTNLIPLNPLDLTVNFDNEAEFGYYENGAAFYWQGGLELLARGRVQGAEVAYDRFQRTMQEFDATRFWGQRYSWLTSQALGSDVITDGAFTLYGGLMGMLNIRTSLTGGVTSLGPAAAELEGAVFTFGLNGEDVTIRVTNGTAAVVARTPVKR
jgi:hypothetical protein